MNGVVSAHQRKQGLNYKINFGVEIPRIKSIAENYPKSKQLAQELWQQNIRECKLLAIFLMPKDEFSTSDADNWIEETQFTEIADHLVMKLLVHEDCAIDKALHRIEEGKGLAPYCGYLTLSHMMREGCILDKEQENKYLHNIICLLGKQSESKTLQQCAYTSLIKYISIDEAEKTEILHNTAKRIGIEEGSVIRQFLV